MPSKALVRSLSLSLLLLTTSWQALATDAPAAPAGAVSATAQATPQTSVPASAPSEAEPPATNAVKAFGQSIGQSISQSISRSAGALPARAEAILDRLGHYTENAQEIVKSGFAYMGVDYRRGGTSAETGFDCSGLVRRVFGDAFGVDLPHNARAISKEGTKISVKDLKPGDLVFFNTLRKTFSHVGIYVGNNLFLHAPSSGGGVRLDDLRERYWVKHFNGARRIETN
ncbi:MAG: C40 family peptidase [Rhodocyclaceae bacterium]|nr:C40 family peptidase [Rhodocyclaceae bacterium]